MKRKYNSRISEETVILLFFISGFLFGALGTNLFLKDKILLNNRLDHYNLKQSIHMIHSDIQYALYLLKARAQLFFLTFVGLKFKSGREWVRLAVLWLSISFGNIITVFIIRYGLKGIAFSIIAAMPQYLFYITAIMLLIRIRSILWESYRKKGVHIWMGIGMIWLILLIGIAMETVVNPKLLNIFLKKL